MFGCKDFGEISVFERERCREDATHEPSERDHHHAHGEELAFSAILPSYAPPGLSALDLFDVIMCTQGSSHSNWV